MDVLADRLGRAQARGAVFALSTLSPPWGVSMVDHTPLSVHSAIRGDFWLLPRPGTTDQAVHLLQGDIALVHSTSQYVLADDPRTEPVPLPIAPAGSPPRVVAPIDPRTDARTLLLCGSYRFDGDVCDSLLACLPPVVVLRAGDLPRRGGSSSVRAVLALMADELGVAEPGQAAALDRLLDLLLVYVLRAWFATADVPAPPWYRALADQDVGAALALIHAEPATAWTVASLGHAVGLSRAAFARRFSALVGEPPLTYLTSWRMSLAADALRTTDRTIASIAREVGYDNEFAFSTAFARHHGVRPSVYRRASAA